jgi:UDP-N-acetylglucosamine--N-acetylmuramyl-(pentapeptide) pyrophosphoryl-undecaprenol N-acetylglucosamine transferase
MKILLTGGGTGGHFYPLVAVAAELKVIARDRQLVPPEIFYAGPNEYDAKALFENGITFLRVPAGKWRRYFSFFNFTDGLKTLTGLGLALWHLYFLYPDVVFSKGGYASFPVLWAAKLLRIPVLIHESDAHPGRVSVWSAKFAARIALAFPEAANYLPIKPESPVAVVGQPIRPALKRPRPEGAREFLKFAPEWPVVLILGGSQGAQSINNLIGDVLPQLVAKAAVVHQVGPKNLSEAKKLADFKLADPAQRSRYQVFDTLTEGSLAMVAGVADLVISRAGAGAIFEIANWGLPAIIIPLPEEVSHDQRANALSYGASGGAVVIEQANLTPSILMSEIGQILDNPELKTKMGEAARTFARPDAGRVIAEEIVNLALEHEA